MKHLKSDVAVLKREAKEDKALIKDLKKSKKAKDPKKPKSKVSKKKKIEKVMREFKYGELHSGSEKGPLVKNPKQAIAIGLSEAGVSKKKKKKSKK